MPELPDLTVYVEALERRVIGHRLEEIRLNSPFVLRTVVPPVAEAQGRRVTGVQRLGKRIVIALESEIFLVLHLMIAGRLRWLSGGAKPPARITLATFAFDTGVLAFTEAGTRKRASLHLVQGATALAEFDRGGIELDDIDASTFAARLTQENHTLKRALTDPRLFSGIGNAYSDEILHRARLSPLALTHKLSTEETERLFASWPNGPSACGAKPARIFRKASPRSGRRWPCTAVSASHARIVARRCSASSTPTTKPTIARIARRGARYWPIARCRAC